MNKKIMILMVFVLVLSLACNVEHAQPVLDSESIEIATILFLTGNQASLGEEINNAFQIAKADFETKNKVEIKLNIEDSCDDPKKAISAYQKLKSEEYPIMISTGDAVGEALAPLASQDEIILFNTVSASQDVSNEWLFRGWMTAAQQGRPLAEFISEKQYKDIALIKLNNIYSVSFTNAFKEALSKDVNIISEEAYNIADTDMKTQLLKIKSKNPEAIVVSGFGPAYPIIFKQMKELGINKPIFADATISIPYFFMSAGGYEILDGLYFTSTNFDLENPANQKTLDFINKYKEYSGNDPSFAAAFGYDTLMVVAETLKDCDSKDSNKIKNCLSELTYEGILGKMEFNSEGEMQIPLYIKQVKDGKTVVVKEI